MSAARKLLPALLLSVLLAGCVDFTSGPDPSGPDPTNPDPLPGPEGSITYPSEARDRDSRDTFLTAGDGGAIYLTTARFVTPTRFLDPSVMTFDADGSLLRDEPVAKGSGRGAEFKGIVATGQNSAIAFGKLMSPPEWFASIIKPNGEFTPDSPIELGNETEHRLRGGVPGPNGTALLYSLVPTDDTQLLFILIDAQGGLQQHLIDLEYEATTIKDVTYAPNPPGGAHPNGAILSLSQRQHCADLHAAPPTPGQCSDIRNQAFIDIVDAGTFERVIDPVRLPLAHGSDSIDYIEATPDGRLFLLGTTTPRSPLLTEMLVLHYDLATKELKRNSFEGNEGVTIRAVALTAEGDLLVGGFSNSSYWTDTLRGTELPHTGKGTAFLAKVTGPTPNIEWTSKIGDPDQEWVGLGATSHPDNGYYLAGTYSCRSQGAGDECSESELSSPGLFLAHFPK